MLAFVQSNQYIDIAIRRLLATKPVYGYVYPGKRQDIGNPQGYFKALEAFNDRCGKG